MCLHSHYDIHGISQIRKKKLKMTKLRVLSWNGYFLTRYWGHAEVISNVQSWDRRCSCIPQQEHELYFPLLYGSHYYTILYIYTVKMRQTIIMQLLLWLLCIQIINSLTEHEGSQAALLKLEERLGISIPSLVPQQNQTDCFWLLQHTQKQLPK